MQSVERLVVVLKFIWREPMARDQMCGRVGELLRIIGLSGLQVSYPEKEVIVGKKWIKKKIFALLLL